MIKLDGLRLRVGDFSLQVDELALEEGELLVILGPTGSGKTVLLETVAGLRRLDAGHVWFGERDVTAEAPEQRRVGFVYQDYALFPHLTVARNIGFGVQSRKLGYGKGEIGVEPDRPGAEDRVRSLAELLGIDSLLERYPESLSGGEKQRVALARALAIEPDVLLLDEPLSALDRQTREGLRGLLKDLHHRLGATVMHVTHDLDEALALADRLAVLIDGRIRQIGRPAEVVRYPADAEVAGLLGLTNVFPVEVSKQGEDFVVRLTNSGLSLIASSLPDGRENGSRYAVIRAEEIEVSADDAAAWDDDVSSTAATSNMLRGVVRDIRLHAAHVTLEVEVPPLFSVHVLHPQVRRLGIGPGNTVTLHVPPNAIHVCGVGPNASAL